MDSNRQQAYAFLLNAALLHLKWDLTNFWKGMDWRPWRFIEQSRRVKRAARRAIAFHNLATFMAHGMEAFEEDRFWREIQDFTEQFPEDSAKYRRMFDRKLAGEEVMIIRPGG